jgi:hypothetical protein
LGYNLEPFAAQALGDKHFKVGIRFAPGGHAGVEASGEGIL